MIMRVEELPDLLTIEQTCKVLGVSKPTLREGWRAGEYPPPLKLGRRHMWPKWRIQEFLGYNPSPNNGNGNNGEDLVEEITERVMGRLARAFGEKIA